MANVASDLFSLRGQDYIVVVDYFSRYFELERLLKTNSTTVIGKLKGIFSRFGIPEKVLSDNGPQYASHEFDTFANQWDFDHVTSSPRYPLSNGLAENSVQTIMRILKTAQSSGKDPCLRISHNSIILWLFPRTASDEQETEISVAQFTESTYTKHS